MVRTLFGVDGGSNEKCADDVDIDGAVRGWFSDVWCIVSDDSSYTHKYIHIIKSQWTKLVFVLQVFLIVRYPVSNKYSLIPIQ